MAIPEKIRRSVKESKTLIILLRIKISTLLIIHPLLKIIINRDPSMISILLKGMLLLTSVRNNHSTINIRLLLILIPQIKKEEIKWMDFN